MLEFALRVVLVLGDGAGGREEGSVGLGGKRREGQGGGGVSSSSGMDGSRMIVK